jgi:hypothetical protein
MDKLDEKQLWSGDVKTKKHPPENLFADGSAEAIASWLKKEHGTKKGAMSALNFYINRAGSNLKGAQKSKLESVKKLLGESLLEELLTITESQQTNGFKFFETNDGREGPHSLGGCPMIQAPDYSICADSLEVEVVLEDDYEEEPKMFNSIDKAIAFIKRKKLQLPPLDMLQKFKACAAKIK